MQCRTLWVRVRNAARRSREMPKWWCVVLIGSCEIAQQFSPEMRAAGVVALFILVELKIRLLGFSSFGQATHNELKRGTIHCLPQRLKSTFYKFISSETGPLGPAE